MKKTLSIAELMKIDGYSLEVTDLHRGIDQSGSKYVEFKAAYKGEKITGTVSVSISEHSKKGLSVSIDSLRTTPTRLGLGSLIVSQVSFFAKNIGAKEVSVDSLKAATEFWKKVGLATDLDEIENKGMWSGKLSDNSNDRKQR